MRFFLLAALAGVAYSQGVITTVVGTDAIFQDSGKLATQARIGRIGGLAFDPSSGDLYLSDPDNFMILRVGRNGIVRVFAGNGIQGVSGDGGPATSASMNQPAKIAVDSRGAVYVADVGARRVRRITPDGIISTVAGNGLGGFTGDNGPALLAGITPRGVAVDAAGNIYIADQAANRIRRVTADGVIRTIAGTGSAVSSGDGAAATAAGINQPLSVIVDAAGNLFVGETGRVRRIAASDGRISTYAGGGTLTTENIQATAAALTNPQGLRVDAAGTLYIAETGGNRIRTVTTDGVIRTIAGGGLAGFSGDGLRAANAQLRNVLDVAIGANGTYFIADSGNFRIRAVDNAGNISTFAGNGLFLSVPDGSPAATAALSQPTGLALDPSGNLFIAESGLNRIRKVTTAGAISTVAGLGQVGGAPNPAPANLSPLSTPFGVAADGNGNFYICDTFASIIRKVDSRGNISIYAGGGNSRAENVAATTALLSTPQGIALDTAGNLYIADTQNHLVRRVTPAGIISTIAGTGVGGFAGDGATALQAQLFRPLAVAVTSAGDVIIADSSNLRVRRVTPNTTITTIAGNGSANPGADGATANATGIGLPQGVAVDANGNVYIAGSNRVVRIEGGVLRVVAGTGAIGFSGDGGVATQARLASPYGVAVAANGSVYIADQINDRVRVVLPGAPVFSSSPASLNFSGQSGGSPATAQSISLSSTVAGMPFTIAAGLPAWLTVSPMTGTLPSVLQVIANPATLPQGNSTATITINVPNATPASRTVGVSFAVGAGVSPKLSVLDTNLTFAFGAQSTPDLQGISVANAGGGALAFTATASTSSGGNWLSVTPASGSATPAAPVQIGVRATPGSLAPGVYLGQVTILAGAQSATVAVTMSISAVRQSILLSQGGLTFTAVANGGFVLPQSFSVLNAGQGVMNWTTNVTTLSGGPWLAVSASAGSSDASAASVPAVQVSVTAAGLAAGAYYGRIRVASTTADNSPQSVFVVLRVLPAGSNPGPDVQPAGLTFTGVTGGLTPGSQALQIGNPAGGSLSYVSGRLTFDGADWFVASPATGEVPPDRAATLVVQPVITNLTAGVRRGVLTLLFSDGSNRTVSVLLVLAPSAGSSADPFTGARNAAGCTPTRLLPLIGTVGQNFVFPAAWPSAIVTKVVDDCGDLMTSGSVTASFSNGDPPLSLVSLKDGSWSGTWQPRGSGAQTSINVTAQIPDQNLQGSISISGSLQPNPDPPQVNAGGVVSAASFSQVGVLAPGSFISIYGTRFADGLNIAPSFPWTTELVGTEVILGGRSLPLFFTSTGQINAVVPIDTPPNSRQQLVVRRGFTFTAPESVSIAAAQPAIFTPSQTGKGQGYTLVSSGGVETLADSRNPAKAGDVIVTYCAGLGVTNPAVADGAPASTTALSPTVNPVTMTIGGRDAELFFAGLAPGFIGLYQVNGYVPSGVTPGDAVPVVLTVGGQSSPVVTMAVR